MMVSVSANMTDGVARTNSLDAAQQNPSIPFICPDTCVSILLRRILFFVIRQSPNLWTPPKI